MIVTKPESLKRLTVPLSRNPNFIWLDLLFNGGIFNQTLLMMNKYLVKGMNSMHKNLGKFPSSLSHFKDKVQIILTKISESNKVISAQCLSKIKDKGNAILSFFRLPTVFKHSSFSFGKRYVFL